MPSIWRGAAVSAHGEAGKVLHGRADTCIPEFEGTWEKHGYLIWLQPVGLSAACRGQAVDCKPTSRQAIHFTGLIVSASRNWGSKDR